MPTYRYRCPDCQNEFDELQGINDKPDAQCPICKSLKPVRIIVAGAAIMFKGKGFYVNDYRKNNNHIP